ncbi:MAG: SH3 domain-containing protein, partial [Acidobacteriota bacterium]
MPTPGPLSLSIRLSTLLVLAASFGIGLSATESRGQVLSNLTVVGDAPLRAAPSLDAPVLRRLRDGQPLLLDGPAPPPWIRVRTSDGIRGYIAGVLQDDRVEADEKRVGQGLLAPATLRLHTPAILRDGPAAGRREVARLDVGSRARVLEQLGTWVLLADAENRDGWADLA